MGIKSRGSRYRKDERGVTSIEYAIIAGGLAIAIIIGVSNLGGGLKSSFDKIAVGTASSSGASSSSGGTGAASGSGGGDSKKGTAGAGGSAAGGGDGKKDKKKDKRNKGKKKGGKPKG